MRKPDILCIGAQKAGTTWFHTNFGARDDVWVPPFKELHYFDFHYAPDSADWAAQHIRRSVKEAIRRHVLAGTDVDLELLSYLMRAQSEPMFTRRWYGAMFERAGAAQQALDVTPEYSCISEQGVQFVRRFLPETRFIYILRDPVARAVSQMKMNLKRRKKEPQTRAEWLWAARQPVIGVRGDYKAYVPRWREAFGDSRLLFMPFGLIAKAPDRFMAQVEGFLGMPPARYPAAARPVHQGIDLQVPGYVIEFLSEQLRPQSAFLAREFDPTFCASL